MAPEVTTVTFGVIGGGFDLHGSFETGASTKLADHKAVGTIVIAVLSLETAVFTGIAIFVLIRLCVKRWRATRPSHTSQTPTLPRAVIGPTHPAWGEAEETRV